MPPLEFPYPHTMNVPLSQVLSFGVTKENKSSMVTKLRVERESWRQPEEDSIALRAYNTRDEIISKFRLRIPVEDLRPLALALLEFADREGL